MGCTIKVDSISVDAYRGRYVQVFVEVEFNKPLKQIITVFGEP